MFGKWLVVIAVLGAVSLSGCVRVLSPEETAPDISYVSAEAFNIAVRDARPYVLDGDKASSFEGLTRSALGIPYSQNTATKEPMADYIAKRLEAGFKNKGIEVNVISTDMNTSNKEIYAKSIESGNKGILIVLKEWKYDYHSFSDNSWYDMDVVIVDELGNKKLAKRFVGEDDIPDFDDAIVNEMQLIYKARFEKVFQDESVRQALLN
ncbi:hypothetical protein BCT30_06270 [Enterovibrio norvegicus]|uniref:Lipoprotein n=2 Tax=Enterovibrio norvegicus TaxID=188144 RepID=A0A1I5JVD8_9GAMM|nr:hypothetical protein [Enterovibrio norvegicus]MCC4797339.1 hypothetical protein [Enterovibrio norvegicus]OEF58398.1 hypothetical protein A1OU_09425 [Enterovibrio norvegicus]OEF64475.1 hypothetical protein A1OW_02700 [Enterovibrio norvegicus]PMH66694.1 hypothetical protein BCU62_08800 [Enterovibrio norvegicus]PMI27063.1 hypothetical protein BCU47_03695 [Enterovibrio norvegicus]